MVLNHHSYVYVNEDSTPLLELLQSNFSDLFIDNLNHPDLWIRNYTTFTIEDSRDLKKFNQTKASLDNKIALISANSITTEAQQSLLKVLEEPYPGVMIFLVLPNINLLLPTIISRVEILEIEDKSIVKNKEALHFLSLSISERLILLEEWRKKDVAENRLWATGLLNGIEMYIKNNNINNGLLSILNIKKYISDQSFSFRLAFLYLALALPEKLS
ncbi:MAG: polymerase subunit delta [Patescibacteria group bacterium]|nr:polymerase subunit delta [Patescibacteria group bacterium]